jgi:hypothetical protein
MVEASAAPAGTSRPQGLDVRLGAAAAGAQGIMGSLEFSKQLLTRPKSRWRRASAIGEDGEGFVRIAMVENEQRLRQAARNIKRYLKIISLPAIIDHVLLVKNNIIFPIPLTDFTLAFVGQYRQHGIRISIGHSLRNECIIIFARLCDFPVPNRCGNAPHKGHKNRHRR